MNPHRRFRSRNAALKELARALGYEGREGGWIYNDQGRPLVQGWNKFFERGYLQRRARRLANDPTLSHMPLVDQYGVWWLYTDLVVEALRKVAREAESARNR